ncbi:SgcJ/EcaC family oxidoreductase [Nodularia harveyana UHCC-0300]|uniref:SgcJ/EcaC family oxidoreductase n=1 Tax=Nodularia harveyana UHCC-0300 TaxID=2974287 RepID=A0ABU5UAT4_9CYAN|nr:SgcJ/EcaC family oxidoreductase [Nodularia harveyana]MEA5580639.1 SgcJ/EcaC family oxidoreductase [Nodularia harveyana UHCC-0300]
MKRIIARSALLSIFGATISCASILPINTVEAKWKCPRVTRPEIAQLFDRWNNSLQTGDPNLVTQNYAKNAVLLPTVSNQVRQNHEEIQDYFVKFLKLQPVGRINDRNIRLYCGVAIDSGTYTFRIINNGEIEDVKARYTFVYHKFGNEWLITEHHSSAMPETINNGAE